MKLISTLINSNIYISLAAVSLTVAAQIQLGMRPQWHPYLFIVFFATLFEYNLHRLITVLTNKEAFNSVKHQWVGKNLRFFYSIVFISLAGFILVAFMARKEVLIAFAPIAVLTLLYSIPVFGGEKRIFRLREIPYLKIFLISFVWSGATILLPVIQSNDTYGKAHIATMLTERFFFILAITIPFDIRDMDADRRAGLKTIPLFLNEKRAIVISYVSLLFFLLISFFHYQRDPYVIWAFSISALTTYLFLKSKKIRSLPFYHYGVLDGTMLLQGVLVLVFYYFTWN